MRLTIDIVRDDTGVMRATLRRGERVQQAVLDGLAARRLYQLTDRIDEACKNAAAGKRHGEGRRARMIRRICERDGRVTIASLMAESGRTERQCRDALRAAAWRRKLLPVAGADWTYVLPPPAAKEDA